MEREEFVKAAQPANDRSVMSGQDAIRYMASQAGGG